MLSLSSIEYILYMYMFEKYTPSPFFRTYSYTWATPFVHSEGIVVFLGIYFFDNDKKSANTIENEVFVAGMTMVVPQLRSTNRAEYGLGRADIPTKGFSESSSLSTGLSTVNLLRMPVKKT